MPVNRLYECWGFCANTSKFTKYNVAELNRNYVLGCMYMSCLTDCSSPFVKTVTTKLLQVYSVLLYLKCNCNVILVLLKVVM